VYESDTGVALDQSPVAQLPIMLNTLSPLDMLPFLLLCLLLFPVVAQGLRGAVQGPVQQMRPPLRAAQEQP
jgi:hypothetical protein